MVENKAIARTVSLGLEYPSEHLQLQGKHYPVFLLTRLLGLGVAGVLLAMGLTRSVAALRETRGKRTKQLGGPSRKVKV
jgi:hypothetical protein